LGDERSQSRPAEKASAALLTATIGSPWHFYALRISSFNGRQFPLKVAK
jgi:hypothetical protein